MWFLLVIVADYLIVEWLQVGLKWLKERFCTCLVLSGCVITATCSIQNWDWLNQSLKTELLNIGMWRTVYKNLKKVKPSKPKNNFFIKQHGYLFIFEYSFLHNFPSFCLTYSQIKILTCTLCGVGRYTLCSIVPFQETDGMYHCYN